MFSMQLRIPSALVAAEVVTVVVPDVITIVTPDFDMDPSEINLAVII